MALIKTSLGYFCKIKGDPARIRHRALEVSIPAAAAEDIVTGPVFVRSIHDSSPLWVVIFSPTHGGILSKRQWNMTIAKSELYQDNECLLLQEQLRPGDL